MRKTRLAEASLGLVFVGAALTGCQDDPEKPKAPNTPEARVATHTPAPALSPEAARKCGALTVEPEFSMHGPFNDPTSITTVNRGKECIALRPEGVETKEVAIEPDKEFEVLCFTGNDTPDLRVRFNDKVGLVTLGEQVIAIYKDGGYPNHLGSCPENPNAPPPPTPPL